MNCFKILIPTLLFISCSDESDKINVEQSYSVQEEIIRYCDNEFILLKSESPNNIEFDFNFDLRNKGLSDFKYIQNQTKF